jgi:hypothetical protein
MRKYLWIIVVLFVATAAPPITRAQTAFSIDDSLFGGTLTGDITISGVSLSSTPTSITASDITGWTLNWSEGTSGIPSFGLCSTCGTDVLFINLPLSGDLTATTTDLIFDWDSGDSAALNFETSGAGTTQIEYLAAGDTEAFLEVRNSGVYGEETDPSNDVIATAVTPEPDTAVLWFTGIGLMILLRKRVAHLLRLDANSSLSLPAAR